MKRDRQAEESPVALGREDRDDSFEGTILPQQGTHGDDSLRARSGPLRLMLAVLEDAVLCYRDREALRADRRMDARRAETWIRRTDAEELFSFESICAQLGFEAEEIRLKVLELPPSREARRASRSHRVARGGRRHAIGSGVRRRWREVVERDGDANS